MKTPRYLLVVLSLISVIAISIGGFTFIKGAASEHVYAFNCGLVDYKPTTLTQYCADAGVAITDIKWETWNAKGATGTASYALNQCEPSCAAGKWLFVDVNVELSKAVTHQNKTVLSHIEIATVDKKKFLPMSKLRTQSWDLISTKM